MRILLIIASATFAIACSSSGGDSTPLNATTSTTSTATSAQTTSSGAGGAGQGGAGQGGAEQSGSGGSGGGQDTYANYAEGFFAKYCIECHGASMPSPMFTTLAGITAEAATIRCGVAATMQSGCAASPPPKQFPISDAAGTNPKPTDAERARIVAWIDNGTP